MVSLINKSYVFDTECFDAEITELQEEMTVTAELIQKCVDENARTAISQDKYKKKYDALVKRFEKAKKRLQEIHDTKSDREARRLQTDHFMRELKSKKALLQSSMRSCGTPWLTASRFTAKTTSALPSRMERNTKYKSIKRTPHYHYGGEEFFNLFDKLELVYFFFFGSGSSSYIASNSFFRSAPSSISPTRSISFAPS